jgi:hypothetical protein
MEPKEPKKSGSEHEAKILESTEAHGHSIVIREVREREQARRELWIDGKKQQFIETERGYLIAYTEAETLVDAAKLFVERMEGAGKDEEETR